MARRTTTAALLLLLSLAAADGQIETNLGTIEPALDEEPTEKLAAIDYTAEPVDPEILNPEPVESEEEDVGENENLDDAAQAKILDNKVSSGRQPVSP